MKTIIKKSLQSLLLVPALALGVSAVMPVLQPAEVHAQAQCDTLTTVRDGVDCAQGEGQDKSLFDADGIFQIIVNTLLFIIGAVAVIMLVYGGFKYVTSAGDSSAVTSAKNTILYAVIGIVVALLSWAILDFVLNQLGQTS